VSNQAFVALCSFIIVYIPAAAAGQLQRKALLDIVGALKQNRVIKMSQTLYTSQPWKAILIYNQSPEHTINA
jgi:hypothetical protein